MEAMYIIHLSSLIKSYLSVFLEVSESRTHETEPHEP
jgi:hypothetical protein